MVDAFDIPMNRRQDEVSVNVTKDGLGNIVRWNIVVRVPWARSVSVFPRATHRFVSVPCIAGVLVVFSSVPSVIISIRIELV